MSVPVRHVCVVDGPDKRVSSVIAGANPPENLLGFGRELKEPGPEERYAEWDLNADAKHEETRVRPSPLRWVPDIAGDSIPRFRPDLSTENRNMQAIAEVGVVLPVFVEMEIMARYKGQRRPIPDMLEVRVCLAKQVSGEG